MKRMATTSIAIIAAAATTLIPVSSAHAGTGNMCRGTVKKTVGLYWSGGDGLSAGTVSLYRGATTNWCALATSHTPGKNNMRVEVDSDKTNPSKFPENGSYIGVYNGGQISTAIAAPKTRGWAWAELVRYTHYYDGNTGWQNW